MHPFQVVITLVGIVIIILACYYVTYYIGVKASAQSRGRLRNKNINVLDRFAISKDKSFCLVEIAGKVYVVGITNQSMTLIDTIDAAAFAKEAAAERRDTAVWPAVQDGKIISRMTKRLAAFLAERMGRTLEGDDSATFADSMNNARNNKRSGQNDHTQAEWMDDPEEKE